MFKEIKKQTGIYLSINKFIQSKTNAIFLVKLKSV